MTAQTNASVAVKQHAGGMPRYLQLGTLFRRLVSSGQWSDGAQIPTVEDLAAEYGVARATVRQALGILESEGLIERFRAKGTFVTYQAQEQIWCEVETDWNGLLISREGATIELISDEPGHQPPVLVHPIGERARAYRRLRRRHIRHGAPYLIADTYFEESLAKKIPAAAVASKTSLSILAGLKGVKVTDVRQTLTIGSADVDTAEQLQIPLNAPVAYVRRSAADDAGRLIFVTEGIYRGDLVRLDLRLK